MSLISPTTASGSVSFTFCVDDVTHTSLAYDATSNAATCASR